MICHSMCRAAYAAAVVTFLIFPMDAVACTADGLPALSDEVILSIDGQIALSAADQGVAFDLAMLRAMEQTTFQTSTIWTEGTQTFTGVSLHTLLDCLGATGTVIAASALNDYTIEIPVSDAVEGGPILAYEVNGKPLSVREKGPLWIVYPYDASSAYQSEVIYARSIWQVARLQVR
jgi:hypothetical protein